MNDFQNLMADRAASERPTEKVKRPPGSLVGDSQDLTLAPGRGGGQSLRRASVAIILACWTIQYCATSVLVLAEGGTSLNNLYVPRLFVTLAGVAVSFLMMAIQNRLRDFSLSVRGLIAALMGVFAPVLSTIVNYIVFYVIYDFSESGLPSAIDLAQDYLMRLWIYGSLSAIILALSYAADIREREQRIHALQTLAHSAQLRALRNQLNPHFLFNALNSIAGLMRTRRPTEAERMTENLADFLRTTLALDPQSMITLAEELRLQDLYLAIEKVRFPDRLHLAIDVPHDLERALVPSLLTQPLIENSIKYAVARSTDPVTLSVSARAVGDLLELSIADDGGNADAAPAPSNRLGLRNIAERLLIHFGEEAAIHCAPAPGGGFVNRLTIPLRYAS